MAEEFDYLDLRASRAAAEATVRKSWLAAAGLGGVVGATPASFVDVAAVAPIQIVMINAISAHYNLPQCERQATFSLSTIIAAGTAAGSRVVVRSATKAVKKRALKMIAARAARLVPLVGPAVGGVISASTAASTTYALGKAWIQVCEYVSRNDLKKLDEFLESKEGQMVLTFLAQVGLGALLAIYKAGFDLEDEKAAEFEDAFDGAPVEGVVTDPEVIKEIILERDEARKAVARLTSLGTEETYLLRLHLDVNEKALEDTIEIYQKLLSKQLRKELKDGAGDVSIKVIAGALNLPEEFTETAEFMRIMQLIWGTGKLAFGVDKEGSREALMKIFEECRKIRWAQMYTPYQEQ
ncbi:hypothetical protein DPM19_29955 [Actinomadura craniellae]|uniref:DUF697 domain-containing protein n=1 Tax=Actinomadura craniellae TaxID=2231787 RepID=A0A365GXH0_9ACTN|nr:DUF697 domain-containing protein [Actinomadura craniellae]RAY11529.1 hypothetical protein DPM19_29955 [Actinomadura craniellae]